jgi:hypothetical protein
VADPSRVRRQRSEDSSSDSRSSILSMTAHTATWR